MRRSLHRVTVAVIAFVSLSGFVLVSALDAPVAAAASGASPRVTLVSSGNSPRSPLRLALTEGTVTQATMEFSESIKQSLDGKPTTAVTTPPIQVVLESTVGPVSSEGNAQVSYVYRDVTVVDDGSTSATRRDQLETGLAPLTAVTTSGTVTTRNAFVDFKTEGTEGLDPSVAQILNQLTDQFSSLSVPFPREAVGTGARWRATTSVRVAGIDVQQSYIYRLRERDSSHVVFGVTVTQTAPRQRAELPGVPRSAKVDITKYRASGSGSITLDLTDVMPLDSTIHASGTQVFHIRAQGENGDLSQSLSSDVSISRPGGGTES